MYEILKEGGFTNGGLNFDAKARRQSNTYEDILLSYISGMDAFALGLRRAADIIEDGRLDEFVDERYASYKTGFGKDLLDGKVTLESAAEYAKTLKDFDVASGRQEHLENVLNQIMFK